MTEVKALVAGRLLSGGAVFDVFDKYAGRLIAEAETSTAGHVEQAVAIAEKAFAQDVPTPARRHEVLLRASDLLEERRGIFFEALVSEAGFTAADATNEIDRARLTLSLCADEARRIVGELVPFAASPGQENRVGFTVRNGVGVVCAITPFNSPLNVVLHKIAPALAAGNAVVLKPSGFTPVTAMLLARLLFDAGLPPTLLSVLHDVDGEAAKLLLADQRIGFYTFTGSTRVGRAIQAAAGLRRTQLELGSIASTILCEDADLERAIPKIANASFRKAGQVCTSVQRLYVQQSRHGETLEALARAARLMPAGDPRKPATRIGPLISEASAIRVEGIVRDARNLGAVIACGGEREQAVVQPTILTAVPSGARALAEEIFGPVVCVIPFGELDEAVAGANGTPFGLSVGLFTCNIDVALKTVPRLRFGSVHVNETSSARADGMPFGGVKDSGFGHEGPRYAIREYTEERLVTFNT